MAFNASFTGGVRVALGNVVGTNDVIAGTGPGTAALVRVFRGPAHTEVYSFFPYASNFNLGVFVAGGDINGDGRADIIVGTGDGAGSAPQVKVFSGADGTTVLQSFFAFTPSFTGGVRVAAGDVNGDGRDDIIVGSGPGAGHVKVFSGTNLAEIGSFFPYAGFNGGIFVATGDVNGDGFDDIITGTQTGAAHVKVFSGANNSELQSFFAFSGATGGVRVAATDLNGNGRADIIAGTGPGDVSRLRGFDGQTLAGLVDVAPYGSSTVGVFPGAIPHFPAQSLNISTRANVLNGDNALIGGFIVTGVDSKFVLIRGIGPSTGLSGALADPTLELFSGNTSVATNNNWKDTQQALIQGTGIPPTSDLEAAILRFLAPGSYTAVLRGNGGGTGVGLVEAYDLNAATTDSQLANISTRGFVQTGNNVMIAGVILGGGTGANNIFIRALGPSLGQLGVSNALGNPTLELRDNQGTLIRANDNWKQTQQSEIQATGIPPANDLEAALVAILSPGSYTAVVAGAGGGTGVGLVEVYNMQ